MYSGQKGSGKAAASGEVAIFQVLFRTANRRPRQSEGLRTFENSLSGQTGYDLFYEIIAVRERRPAVLLLERRIFGTPQHVLDSDLVGEFDEGALLAFKRTETRQHVDIVRAG